MELGPTNVLNQASTGLESCRLGGGEGTPEPRPRERADSLADESKARMLGAVGAGEIDSLVFQRGSLHSGHPSWPCVALLHVQESGPSPLALATQPGTEQMLCRRGGGVVWMLPPSHMCWRSPMSSGGQGQRAGALRAWMIEGSSSFEITADHTCLTSCPPVRSTAGAVALRNMCVGQ